MQHIGNNKISLIVNNHIQQFEIKATLPFSNRSNFKPPLYRGNAHLLVANGKKNHSLSIHHPHHFHLNNNGNHLKVIPTTNKKPKNLNTNNNNSINNISINHSNSNSINLQSNIPNSFHRPQSPVVLNISSDRHNLYQQQQQQYSFQHQAHNQIHNNSNNNNNNNNSNSNYNNACVGGNQGQIGFVKDRPQRKNRHNSIKLIKQKAEHSVSSKQIGSINILQSHNPYYQKHNIIPSLIESPITKSSHNQNNHSNINGNFSSNDHTSDLDKANNSSNTNNATISNINISNIQIMNNSSSNNNTNSNQNGNSSSQNYNNNNQNQNNSISSSFQNIGGLQNNCPISTESNRNSINNLSGINNNNNINNSCSNTNHNNKSNLSSYKRQEKKYRISKTQILFPFNSKENICDPESQNAAQNSSSKNNISNACNQNQSNHNSSQKISNINNSHHGSNGNIHALKQISNNPKIVNNQNFEEDVILFNKAISQPTEVLREQMALGTPPQLAAYTTSATTDTIHRQSFRIKHYNLSSRQSSRGGLKSTQTSDPISSLQTHNNIGESITQSSNNNNNNNNNNLQFYVNKQTLAKLSHQELGDLSPCNKYQNPPQYHYHHNNFNQNNFPYNYNFNQKSSSNINISNNIINNTNLNFGNNHVNNQQGRILSSRSANKISQNMIKKIIRQPSTHIQSEEGNSILRKCNIQNNKLNQQANAIVRKNSYWQNQREQLERKKKKEKSMISSNNDVTETHHTIIASQQNQQTEPFSIDDQEEENKNQHLLFKFPSKDEKQFFIQHDKNIDQANLPRRDNSPKLNISNNNNLNTINTNNPKSSKRTSIGRISQKQQQLLAHQPVHQVQVQQNINQQQQQQQQQIQQIQNKFPQFNLQPQLQSNGQNILNSINQSNNLFSLNQMSTLLNIKTLSIKKAISNDYSNRHDDIMITGTNPFHDVELRELLGEGAYGKVYKGFIKKTGKFIAVKQLKLGLKDNNKLQEKLEQYLQEIALLNHLEHPNIVKYYDCKHEDDNILIYMEQMPGGSLSSMLEKFGRFEEALIKKFVKQIISGLAYLHSQGIVHRDIKGANILTDGNGTVKLADFGAARYRDTICLPTADGSEFCNSIKGSLYWMAPELLNQETHGRKSDIWSLGCTMIEMATGKHPWPDCRTFPQLALIVKTNQCPPIPEHLSDECKDFIRKCCTFDKKERPTADSLLKHPFLNDD